MNEKLASVKASVVASLQGARAFYAQHRALLLSGLTILSIVLIVWARLGFTLELSKFYAQQNPATCGDGICDVGEVNTCQGDCGAGPGGGGAGGGGGATPTTNPAAETASCGSFGGAVCLPRTAASCGAGYSDTGHKTVDCDSGYGLCCSVAIAATTTPPLPTTTGTPASTCGPSIPDGGAFNWQYVKNENWDTNCVEGQSNINPQEAFYVGVNVQACHPNGLHLVWRADVRNKASCDMKLAADRQLSEGAGITTQVSANVTNMDWPNGQAGNATMTYNPATLNCGSVHLWGAFWASGPQSSNLNAGNTGYHVVLNYGKDCGATTPTPTAAPTPTPTATAVRTPTPTPTPTATATISRSPTPTPISSSTLLPTPTSSSIVSSSPTPTNTAAPSPIPGMAISVNGRNVTAASALSTVVQAQGGQQVEGVVVVRNTQAVTLNNVVLRVALPNGLTYVAGSTSVAGTPTAIDSITTGGLSIGSIAAQKDVSVAFRMLVVGASFVVGTTQVAVPVSATADAVAQQNASFAVVVSRVASAPGTVQTGPGDAVLAAFLMSAIMTLLYVSYTHTSAYKRKEIQAITHSRDPMDFRS